MESPHEYLTGLSVAGPLIGTLILLAVFTVFLLSLKYVINVIRRRRR